MPDMNILSGATWYATVNHGNFHRLSDIFRYISPSIVQFPGNF